MGVDIHMSIIKGNEYLAKEIFDGRNSEWFANLRRDGWNDVYDTLPIDYGIPEECPDEVKEDKEDNRTYYDFRYIPVYEMFDWLKDNEPWIDAGWARAYEKWNYEKRGIVPEDGFPHYKPEENDEPYYFIEYEDKYEGGKWLYNYLKKRYGENGIPKDEILIYYFDC